jgi:hypothetical protein
VASCSDFSALKGFPDEGATMLGRLFGKNKDASDEPVCYECGRTLLAGEWTETIEDDNGEERLLCSLCGQARPSAGGERSGAPSGGTNVARVVGDGAAPEAESAGDRATAGERSAPRDENAALWKAIKDRDAQIERLNEELASSEAERQELIGLLAHLQAGTEAAAAAVAAPAAAADTSTGDAGEMAPAPEAEDEPADVLFATPVGDVTAVGPDAGSPQVEAEQAEPVGADDDHPLALEDTANIPAAVLPADDEAAGRDEAEAQASSMTLLQRGVDLLNVSPVPRKIAETNADLGIPTVHVGFDGEAAAVTFMWTMGWYRFTVDVESGEVRLGDRGYEDRTDLQHNASVRADGTVQLAAARISRAAAQRQQGETAGAAESAAPAAQAAAPGDAGEAVPGEPAPAVGAPEILSKSLLGQRTDDELQSWERTQARDFDWDH